MISKLEFILQTSIEKILEPFEYIHVATEEDNDDLLNFYKNESMQLKNESISFTRGNDFFAFYKSTSEKYWCIKFINKDKKISGIGTILRHHRNINGEIKPIAYFCDMRISAHANRITRFQWRKGFQLIIENLNNLGPDDYCVSAYTAILELNNHALNAFTQGKRGVLHKFLGKYYIHSFINNGIFTKNRYRVKEISKKDFCDFYHSHTNSSLLAEAEIYSLKKIEYIDRKSDYIGIYDNDKLCAIASPIFKNRARGLKIQGLKGVKKLATDSLKLLDRPKMQENGELRTLDISYFTYSNDLLLNDVENIISSIQNWIKNENFLKDIHIVNIIDTKYKYNLNIFKTGLHFDTVGHIYELYAENGVSILPKSDFRFEGTFL